MWKNLKYVLMLFLLIVISGWSTSAWGGIYTQYTKIEKSQFNGIKDKYEFSYNGVHTTFTIFSAGAMNYLGTWGTEHMTIPAQKISGVTWTPDPGCSLTLTQYKIVFGNPHSSDVRVYINGGYSTVDGWATNYKAEGVPTGGYEDSDTLFLFATDYIDIYSIELWYEIKATPPVARDTTIYVTKDTEDKQATEDYRTLFTTTGYPSDFDYTYQVMDDDGGTHTHIESDKFFWADVVGDYRVRAAVVAGTDHIGSDWSIATIHVVRWPNTLYAHGSADYSGTVDLESTLSGVELTATNTDYTHYPITCTQTAGDGLLSYNQATGVVTSGDVLGVGTWHMTQPQSDIYEAGAGDFTVTITNNTYVFKNTTSDQQWEQTGNWETGVLPTEKDNARIQGDVTIDEIIKVYAVVIENDAKVTIAPTGGLKVGAGGISGAKKENLKLMAGTGTDTGAGENGYVKGQTGYLKISPYATTPMPQATAELYSIAYFDMTADDRNNVGSWQYVGSPMKDEDVLARTIFTKSWIYNWDEETGAWKNNRKTLKLEPFKGYATSQYSSADGILISQQGQLATNRDTVLNLSYHSASPEAGVNVLANSYAAPIDITKFENADFSGAEATIYLFNTGSKNNVAEANEINDAGQYISIPIHLAGIDGRPSVIPSMQGFYVVATGSGASLKLNYERLVWGATNGNEKLRAPQRTLEEKGSLCIGLSADGWGDKLYIVEEDTYTPAFENGYDAHKMMSGNLNIYSIEGSDSLAVDATNSMIGTRVGVRTGDETAYTMTFSHVNSEDNIALLDTEAGEQIAITEGAMYTFFAEPNSVITGRFQIVEADAPQLTTGIENEGVMNDEWMKAKKFIKDGQLYILKNGMLYNPVGGIVKK